MPLRRSELLKTQAECWIQTGEIFFDEEVQAVLVCFDKSSNEWRKNGVPLVTNPESDEDRRCVRVLLGDVEGVVSMGRIGRGIIVMMMLELVVLLKEEKNESRSNRNKE